MLLLTAILRAKGLPARARCGFAAYFNPPKYEDHWRCEWWNAEAERWQFADPQFDTVWRKKHDLRHDIADVPRDQFLIAADAWKLCRTGQADPRSFGITFVKLRGLWYVAGNIVRDVAGLNRHEVLPWDVWGTQPTKDHVLDRNELAYFDEVAKLTADPDRRWLALRERYLMDPGLKVPFKCSTACARGWNRFRSMW